MWQLGAAEAWEAHFMCTDELLSIIPDHRLLRSQDSKEEKEEQLVLKHQSRTGTVLSTVINFNMAISMTTRPHETDQLSVCPESTTTKLQTTQKRQRARNEEQGEGQSPSAAETSTEQKLQDRQAIQNLEQVVVVAANKLTEANCALPRTKCWQVYGQSRKKSNMKSWQTTCVSIHPFSTT